MSENSATMLSDARCFREDGIVTDPDTPTSGWKRLGHYVVDRRVELGYKKRPALAAATGISLRVLSDIELGKRANYDAVTLTSLERALGWTTGSAARIAAGGEPQMRPSPTPQDEPPDQPGTNVASAMDDEALVKVMTSNLSDDRKRAVIRLLIEERESALRRAENAAKIFDIN